LVVVLTSINADKILGKAPMQGRPCQDFIKLNKFFILNEKSLACMIKMFNIYFVFCVEIERALV
jgi:hypothetical protein